MVESSMQMQVQDNVANARALNTIVECFNGVFHVNILQYYGP